MEHREVSELKANPNNPRGVAVVDDSLRELAASIREQGVLQPILITPDGTIVAGHRRVKACEIAGERTIPVIVRELSETQQIQIMLIENLQRQDLTALQTAKAYQVLMGRGLSAVEIARATGITRRSISEHTSILRLPEALHSYFDDGSLTLRSVPYLLELDVADQERIGIQAAKEIWRVVDVSNAVHRILNPKPKVATIVDKSNLNRIWNRLQDGCYTPETILRCGECERPMFALTCEEIHEYLNALVKEGRAEWRKQGGKKDEQRGMPVMLCVPCGLPSGNQFAVSRGLNAYSMES